MLLGVDVGGTFTDAVIIDNGVIAAQAKIPTTHDELLTGIMTVLDKVITEVKRLDIKRVALSTTVVTNALIQGMIDKVGLITIPGPGMDISELLPARPIELQGYVDHRGRQTAQLSRGLSEYKSEFAKYDVFTVSGKFSVRNPHLEQQVKNYLKQNVKADYISLGSEVSGKLNFIRRTNSAYYNSAVWNRFGEFADAVEKGLALRKIEAPVYVLKADGGTMPLDLARKMPIEAIFTGPAASVLGVMSMHTSIGDAVSLDIGGTTTDIALWREGKPLFSERGAKVAGYDTAVRAFWLRSVGIGGDSYVRREDGLIKIGPMRLGPSAALGGSKPTLADAMIVAGKANFGSRERAFKAIYEISDGCLTVEETANEILNKAAEQIHKAIMAMIDERASEPVYKVVDIIHDQKINPKTVIGVGGAAAGLAPLVAERLKASCKLPIGGMVANAVGAGLARPTIDITLRGDTAQSFYTIPELGIKEHIPTRRFSLDDAEKLCNEYLRQEAKNLGVPISSTEKIYEEEFNLVRGFNTIGKIITCRMQLKPGVLMGIAGREVNI